MIQRDFYQVLGVSRDATSSDIRAAFARLAKLHHPDLARNDLSKRLHDVQEAYRCLSDPNARARHDRALSEIERQHFERQRGVYHRLRRYDDRHPHPQPRSYRRFRWHRLLFVAAGAAVVARVTIGLM